jgi:hypothetical protein
MRTSQEINEICNRLLNKEIGIRALDVTLEEFQRFYSTFVNLTKTIPTVTLVNANDVIVAQFSTISPQHFDIICKHPLLEKEFEFIQKKNWFGPKSPPEGFGTFIWKEIKLNGIKFLFVALVSFILLYWVNSNNLYELLVSLLIQSSTLFLSIYMIFTVSQSKSLYKDVLLFTNGVLQKYYRDDKNITQLGILTIVLTVLTSILIFLFSKLESLLSEQWVTNISRVSKATLTTIVIILLFNTFFTITNYYLERNKDIVERDIVSDILNREYEELQNQLEKNKKAS